MEIFAEEFNGVVPSYYICKSLAKKFSTYRNHIGKVKVQPKQVKNWFRNHHYCNRQGITIGMSALEESLFEAKSTKDGSWYDVDAFLNHRLWETNDPEVHVRFTESGVVEDEWVNLYQCVRQRSLPCADTECVAVICGDHVLCFKESEEQALRFDACVLDVQRNRHDIRGCRCRFHVRYEHDKTEEIVALWKVLRRPETNYRLQTPHATI
ncbi:hypothetical protein QOZ80_6AG0530870 [Eleusine coracana subsp. coracana]|nr:hypothetical protein QOZ80_6AG0530870 [Eleusine coracana subsp. coracana]